MKDNVKTATYDVSRSTPTFSTIIFPVVLYGCKTWSLTLREERKLRVFENMVLRRGGTR